MVLSEGTVVWIRKHGMTLVEIIWNDLNNCCTSRHSGTVMWNPWFCFSLSQSTEKKKKVRVHVILHRRTKIICRQTFYMPILMLWMIWKIADPQTTKMKRASNQGPTDDFSSVAFLAVLATLPLCVMFLLCFSFAIRILCLATMAAVRWMDGWILGYRGRWDPYEAITWLAGCVSCK